MTSTSAAKKQWTRPELVQLGRIADVAGQFGNALEAVTHIRS